MAKATENGPKIWKVLCKFAFVENSNKRVAEIWRPGHRWRDIKMGHIGIKCECRKWIYLAGY
jgi:hypothetical protein